MLKESVIKHAATSAFISVIILPALFFSSCITEGSFVSGSEICKNSDFDYSVYIPKIYGNDKTELGVVVNFLNDCVREFTTSKLRFSCKPDTLQNLLPFYDASECSERLLENERLLISKIEYIAFSNYLSSVCDAYGVTTQNEAHNVCFVLRELEGVEPQK